MKRNFYDVPGRPERKSAGGTPALPGLPAAMPLARWPKWAVAMKEQAVPGDRGLGDTVARVIGPFGSDAFKVWYAEVAGVFSKSCGCAGWHEPWNQRFGYVRVVG